MITGDQVRKFFDRMIRPIRVRIYNMIARAVVESVKDTEAMATVKAQLFKGDNRDGIEYFQDYGFTSVPLKGAEAVIVCPQGNRDHMIAIKVANRTIRLKELAEGEVAMYTDEGDKIHIKRGGELNIVQATKVDIDTPLVELGSGTLEKILNGETFQTFFNQHVHTGNMGVPTGPPTTPSPASHLSNTVKGAQ